MKTSSRGLCIAVLAGATLVTLTAAVRPASAQTISNSGFEAPALAQGGFVYDPSLASSSWTFVGNSGVAHNGSGFTSSNPNAPQGTQVAFVQRTGNFSQTIVFPTAGTVSFSFDAAQRGNSPVFPSHQIITVSLDGSSLGSFEPTGSTYTLFTTAVGTVTGPGPETLTFGGNVVNDQTALVDAISLKFTAALPSAAPEPGDLALIVSGVLSLCGVAAVRRKRAAKA